MIKPFKILILFFSLSFLLNFSIFAQPDPCSSCWQPCDQFPDECYTVFGFNSAEQCQDYCFGIPINTNVWMLIPAGAALLVLAVVGSKKKTAG